MSASLQLPQEAARLWGDPEKRREILAMHERGDSLVDMVDALGLRPAMETDGLEEVLRNLSDAEVQLIRDAFVAEARQVADNPGASFPIDCQVQNVGRRVTVVPAPASANATAPVARIV